MPSDVKEKSEKSEIGTMKTRTDRDPALTATFWAVGGVGVVFAALAWLHFDARSAAGVLVGAVVALGNLWAITRLVRLYLSPGGRAWAAAAGLKLLILVGVLFELLHFGVVALLPVVVGYAALPFGIVMGRIRPAPQPLREER